MVEMFGEGDQNLEENKALALGRPRRKRKPVHFYGPAEFRKNKPLRIVVNKDLKRNILRFSGFLWGPQEEEVTNPKRTETVDQSSSSEMPSKGDEVGDDEAEEEEYDEEEDDEDEEEEEEDEEY